MPEWWTDRPEILNALTPAIERIQRESRVDVLRRVADKGVKWTCPTCGATVPLAVSTHRHATDKEGCAVVVIRTPTAMHRCVTRQEEPA